MNVWKQIDAMKTKFVKDMESAVAAAKSYGFAKPKALPHGEWVASSLKTAKHTTDLRAPSSSDLIAQMKGAFDAAEARIAAAKRG